MKYLILSLLLLISSFNIFASTKQNDSLLNVLRTTVDVNQKIAIYRNLADLNNYTPVELKYLTAIYELTGKDASDVSKARALSDLIVAYMDQNIPDSAFLYMEKLNRIPQSLKTDRYRCYTSMILFYLGITEKNKEQLLQEKLESLNKNKGTESVYAKIEHAYIVAAALEFEKKNKEAAPYIETAIKFATKLPLREGIDYKESTMRLQSRIYSNIERNAEAIESTESLIKVKEDYFNVYCRSERPFYPMKQFYIRNYTSLLINSKFMDDDKANKYLKIVIEMCKATSHPVDKYNCFLSMSNHYTSRNDFKNAIATNDSLIFYAKIIAPYNMAGLLKTSSVLHERSGNYKKALEELRTSYLIKDSLESGSVKKELNLLQVEYGVNKLKYEKSLLEVKNKQLLNVAMIIVLLFAILICLFLYKNLRKEKRLKEDLRVLKNRAEASEKMKTAFVNSMCHEIRTPLNAIVGFSDIISDPTFDSDAESRKVFATEISTNTWLLISLVESMLEVANLDVSDELLEREETDIAGICHNAMDVVRVRGKESIDYNIDIAEMPLMVSTHGHYFAMVIKNILENANKFTQSGSITMECYKDGNMVVIAVTDTGCGIPANKHKAVFERFVKVDEFKQGNGLGLYLCDVIVRRLAGKIYIDPDYTGGTRMIVKLPTT